MQSATAAAGLRVPLSDVEVVRALRRSARRVDVEARELARLGDRAARGLPRTRRALRRQAAACAADVRTLRALARALSARSRARPAPGA